MQYLCASRYIAHCEIIFSGRSANTSAILFREYKGNVKERLECIVMICVDSDLAISFLMSQIQFVTTSDRICKL